MHFVQKNLGTSMKVIFFKFQRFFWGFQCVLVQMLLIQTLQRASLYQKEAYPLSGDVIILCIG